MDLRTVHDVIAALHIDQIGGKIERVHDMIREGYSRLSSAMVRDYDEFKTVVTDYYQYHYNRWMTGANIGADRAHGYAWRSLNERQPFAHLARVQNLLDAEGGYKQAVKMGLTGRHGGMVRVLDNIAESMKKQAVKQYVTHIFLSAISPADYDTRVAFMQEYVRAYGTVMLPGEQLLSPYELAANLEAVIENHVRLINQARTTLQ